MDHVWPLSGIALSVVLGFLAGTLNERQKWRNQRREKLDEKKREAITAAMNWVDPIVSALNTAELKVYSLLHNRIDQRDFLSTYPDLITQLGEMDLSIEHRFLLPKDIYNAGYHIHLALDELKYDAMEATARMRPRGRFW